MKTLPWAPGKWTSEAAARAAHEKARGDAFEIFIFGCSKGTEGFMRDDVLALKEDLLGPNKLDSTVTARINGLTESGCFIMHPAGIHRTTRAGNQAEVLIVSPTCTFQDYLDHEHTKRQPVLTREEAGKVRLEIRGWIDKEKAANKEYKVSPEMMKLRTWLLKIEKPEEKGTESE